MQLQVGQTEMLFVFWKSWAKGFIMNKLKQQRNAVLLITQRILLAWIPHTVTNLFLSIERQAGKLHAAMSQSRVREHELPPPSHFHLPLQWMKWSCHKLFQGEKSYHL